MDRGKSTCLRLLLYFHHPGNNDCMDRDQPLIHFYHKTFLPISDRKTVKPPPYVNEAKLTHEDQVAHVNGVKIRFHRCVVRSLKVNICSLTRWNEQDHPSSRYALSCRLNVLLNVGQIMTRPTPFHQTWARSNSCERFLFILIPFFMLPHLAMSGARLLLSQSQY